MAKRKTLDEWEARHKAPAEPQTLFVPLQAAAYLNMGLSTLAKMRIAKTGEETGPAFFKIVEKVLYRKSDIDAWLESKRVQQATQ